MGAGMFAVRGMIVDVESGEIENGELLIEDGRIVSPGDRKPERIIDYSGKYIVPGFIDAHIHIESSMLMPSAFARAVVPHGTVAVISDPHEIANVKGIKGIEFMVMDGENSPIELYFTAPSCVPATSMETSGAEIGAEEVKRLLEHERCVALGEVMNFPGVVRRDKGVMAKIDAAKRAGKPIDGHAPGLSGNDLKRYIGAGISTDHECTTEEEAREKLRLGMKIMIRAGSSMDNLESLVGIIDEKTLDRLFFVSDDIHAETILEDGHMDRVLRRAVRLGVKPIDALRMVTINPARHYRLNGLGSLKPGKSASFAILDDMKGFRVEAMFVNGRMAAKGGEPAYPSGRKEVPEYMLSSINMAPLSEDDLKIASHESAEVNVIEIGNKWGKAMLKSDGRFLLPDRDSDILPIVVAERHKATGNVGKGFVKGFGLREGALASSVAHDSHNIVCVGENYPDMLFAIESLRKSGGGIVAVKGREILGLLKLPVAGLISIEDAASVRKMISGLHRNAMELGCSLKSPFMELSFIALPVIPKLKITDKGLVDVRNFMLIDAKA